MEKINSRKGDLVLHLTKKKLWYVNSLLYMKLIDRVWSTIDCSQED